jgi:hypothetical protein
MRAKGLECTQLVFEFGIADTPVSLLSVAVIKEDWD